MTGIEQSLLIPKDGPFLFPKGIEKFLSHLPQGPTQFLANKSQTLITSIRIPSPACSLLPLQMPLPCAQPGRGYSWLVVASLRVHRMGKGNEDYFT